MSRLTFRSRLAAFLVGLAFAGAAWCGLETVSHISDLNSSWPLGSDAASTADDHLRNIKTALKNDFANISGAAPISSSTTVPVEGIYVPSAGALGFSSNTTARGSISTTGNWTVLQPSSGNALYAEGLSSQTTFANNTHYGALQIGGQTSTNDFNAIDFTNALAGTNVAARIGQLATGSGSVLQFGVSNNYANGVTTTALVVGYNGSSTFTITGLGPTAAGQVDMTPDKGTFTATYTGFTASSCSPASACTATATWARMGNLVVLQLPVNTGTSNVTTFTMTGLPSAIQPATTQFVPGCFSDWENNTAVGNNAGVQVTASSGTVTLLFGASASGWTASGVKGISTTGCSITYFLN